MQTETQALLLLTVDHELPFPTSSAEVKFYIGMRDTNLSELLEKHLDSLAATIPAVLKENPHDPKLAVSYLQLISTIIVNNTDADAPHPRVAAFTQRVHTELLNLHATYTDRPDVTLAQMLSRDPFNRRADSRVREQLYRLIEVVGEFQAAAIRAGSGPLTEAEKRILDTYLTHPAHAKQHSPHHRNSSGHFEHDRCAELDVHRRPELDIYIATTASHETAIAHLVAAQTPVPAAIDAFLTTHPDYAPTILHNPNLTVTQFEAALSQIDTNAAVGARFGNHDWVRAFVMRTSPTILNQVINTPNALQQPVIDTIIVNPSHFIYRELGSNLTAQSIITLITSPKADTETICTIAGGALASDNDPNELDLIVDHLITNPVTNGSTNWSSWHAPLTHRLLSDERYQHNRDWHRVALMLLPKVHDQAAAAIRIVERSQCLTVDDLTPHKVKGTKFGRAIDTRIAELENTGTPQPAPETAKKNEPLFHGIEDIHSDLKNIPNPTIADALTVCQQALQDTATARTLRGTAGNMIMDILNLNPHQHAPHIDEATWKLLGSLKSVTVTPGAPLIEVCNTGSAGMRRYAATSIHKALSGA